MIDNKVTCKIEYHAILFALLSKNAILLAGEAGKEAIIKGMTEYGKYYCVNVDNAVYQGFRSDFLCTPTTTSLSWGGERCEFDREHPLSAAEYIEKFGQEYFDVLGEINHEEF